MERWGDGEEVVVCFVVWSGGGVGGGEGFGEVARVAGEGRFGGYEGGAGDGVGVEGGDDRVEGLEDVV